MGIKKIQKIIKVGSSSYVCVPPDVKKKLDRDNGDDLAIVYEKVSL